MANLAVILKDEIRRLARKEVRSQSGGTKQAVARYRREIASLKRQLQATNKKLTSLQKKLAREGAASTSESEDEGNQIRFSSRSVRAQRRKLGLSAHDYGRLVGVSGLTIYNWEQGKTRPRQSQLARLVAVRNIGKREALRRLAEANGTSE